MGSPKVTLDDVARRSGVSRSAASRALNAQPGVRPEVRAKVLQVADELGFRPNRAARNLASGRASVIGLVIPTRDLSADPYGVALTHAVGRAAAERDLGMMLHLAADEPGQTLHHIVRDGMIDGLVISSVAIGRPWVDELFDSSLPTVLIGTHPVRHDLLSVDVENVESTAAAVTHLFDQGCRRVGCITGLAHRADARQRLAGFRLAHQRARRDLDPALIVQGDFTRRGGARAAARLLELGVDGIFASNDESAVGALWTLAHRGLRVPADVKVAGFDGTALDEFHEPTLTSIAQPFAEMGAATVDLLMRLVAGDTDVESVVLEPHLVIGTTTDPDAGGAGGPVPR